MARDCGCSGYQAAARKTIDNGSAAAAANVIQQTIYSALGVQTQPAPVGGTGSVEYRNGTFVQTTKPAAEAGTMDAGKKDGT